MFLTLFLFFIGFYILIRGADFLVGGASSLARRFNISPFVIGLVIAGIGTSIPEFGIGLLAHIRGETGLSIGTVVGSSTLNILLILGLAALVFPLPFKKEWVDRDLIWNMFAVVIAFVFAAPLTGGAISRLESIFLLLLFFYWLSMVIKTANGLDDDEQEPLRILTFPIAFLLILAGLLGVVFGGIWVVDGAAFIARELGLSETLIGLTVIGLGTSFPELAVTIAAAYRNQFGIAVGGIIGSNIFNFLMIFGVSALLAPLYFPKELLIDLAVSLFSALLLYGSMFSGVRYTLSRFHGLIFIVVYMLYLVYIIGRG